ncbi:MAG: hypothetical protein U0802_22025 [Candidatus Binatia bacterium]
MPTTTPPARRAPRLAAAMTPPRPPVTSVAPRPATAAPIASAVRNAGRAAVASPITTTCGARSMGSR